LIRTCKVALEDAHSGEMDYIDISSKLESGLDQNGKPTDETKISNSIESIREEIRCIQSGEYVPDVVRTHTGRLDSYLGNNGIGAGEVFVLAAPTSCGKSALALFMALQANRKDGVPVAIFSLEMPQKQLSVRLTQTLSGVSYRGIKDGSATESQVQKFDSTMTSLAEADIYTSHTVKNVEDLISQCRRFVKAHKVKLIVIDYLQLIPFGVNRNGTKAEAIANISHKIKQMALNLNVSVILLAQVNREGAKREGGLSLYDLKDSGDIENDADIVTLMFPTKGDIEASKDVDPNGVPYTHMFTKIAKNREGERDILDSIKFFHTVGRFDI
jgi:replicative DNA helicase